MHEGGADREGGLEQARTKCMDWEMWILFYHGHFLKGQLNEVSVYR